MFVKQYYSVNVISIVIGHSLTHSLCRRPCSRCRKSAEAPAPPPQRRASSHGGHGRSNVLSAVFALIGKPNDHHRDVIGRALLLPLLHPVLTRTAQRTLLRLLL